MQTVYNGLSDYSAAVVVSRRELNAVKEYYQEAQGVLKSKLDKSVQVNRL